jgi:glyoxylase-like metal-dependent hydrolase (beta-lactamase superfamily II)
MTNLTWRIGDVTVTRLVESVRAVAREGFIPAATHDAIAPHIEWLRPHFLDERGDFVLSIHALLVEVGDRRIVVDTCIGNRPLPEEFEMLRGDPSFLDGFAAAGAPPETIDTVICTHLHFDHVGWNTVLVDGRWVPAFPNARYVLSEPEWSYFSRATTPEEIGAAITLDDAVRPLFDARVVDLVPVDHAVADEVRLVPTPGHTPGHVSVRISSRGGEALITGDMAHHPVQFAETDWFTVADTDTARSSATRKRVVEELLDRDVLVIGTHFAEPCAGHLVSTDDGVRLRPLAR